MSKPVSDVIKIIVVKGLSVILALVGLLMTVSALTLEFSVLKPALTTIGETQKSVLENSTRADNPGLVDAKIIAATFPSMLLILNLVGIALILSGIFIVLISIMRALWKLMLENRAEGQ